MPDSANHIRNIAIVGINGRLGNPITVELPKGGSFIVTAISRENSRRERRVPKGTVSSGRVDDRRRRYERRMYTRVLHGDGSGEFEDVLDNAKLGLPAEDFNEATGDAVKMWRGGSRYK